MSDTSIPQRLAGRRILGVFAHPDDETYSMAGVAARYVAEGCVVTMLTFTRGEAGQIGGGSDATPETLGAVREAELREACKIFGCTDVRVVGTPDGGTQNDEEGTQAVVDAIEELKPDIVITMEPEGVTSHPDHKAVSAMTREAVKRTCDKGYPRKLFFSAWPNASLLSFMKMLEERDIHWISPDDPLYPRGAPDQSIAAIVDVMPWISTKRSALKAHVTQSDEIINWCPEDIFNSSMGAEAFQRMWPAKTPGEQPEADLFGDMG
jgi:LmbE family N-acetylglucosaminyl deacetylase